MTATKESSSSSPSSTIPTTITPNKNLQTHFGFGGINVHGLHNLSAAHSATIAASVCRMAQQQQHQHHFHQNVLPSKVPLKPSSRIGPSPLRQLLPVALCVLTFATVLSILIVYMDTTGN